MNSPSISKNKSLTEKWFQTDENLNHLYPPAMQFLAKRHWTPLTVAIKATNFLAAEKNAKILDIGSGIGKFCLTAGFFKPDAVITGIEQRKTLVHHAEIARQVLNLENVSFINGNFTQIDFNVFDHFYFYNSFYENLSGTNKIDDCLDYSSELYNYYNRYLHKQLELKPAGTRLATYHSLEDEIPASYHIAGTDMNNLLKFWIKS